MTTPEREHPGTGEPMEGIEASPDASPVELTGDGTGQALPPIEETAADDAGDASGDELAGEEVDDDDLDDDDEDSAANG